MDGGGTMSVPLSHTLTMDLLFFLSFTSCICSPFISLFLHLHSVPLQPPPQERIKC